MDIRKPKIIDVEKRPKRYFEGGGGFKRVVISKQEEGMDLTAYWATIEPGKAHDWHDHEQDEVAYIAQGWGKYFLEDGEIEYSSGDIVFLPKGTSHKNLVLGKENVIIFAVFTPARI